MPQILLVATVLSLLGLAHVGVVAWANPSAPDGEYRLGRRTLLVSTSWDWWPYGWHPTQHRPTLVVDAGGLLIQTDASGITEEPIRCRTTGWPDPHAAWVGPAGSPHSLQRRADGKLVLYRRQAGSCVIMGLVLNPIVPP